MNKSAPPKGGGGGAAATTATAPTKKKETLSLPILVIQDAIKAAAAATQVPSSSSAPAPNADTGKTEAAVGGIPPLPRPLTVEVEVVQGYVYRGTLLSIDSYGNMALEGAVAWRERTFDIFRHAEQKHNAEQARLYPDMAELLDTVPPDPPGCPTRPKAVGRVYLRSVHTVVLRLAPSPLPPSDSETAGGGGGVTTSALVNDGSGSSEAAASAQEKRLVASFRQAVQLVRRERDAERMRNRAARRNRLEAAKGKRERETEGRSKGPAEPKKKRRRKERR